MSFPYAYSLRLLLGVYVCVVWCNVVEEGSEKPLSDEKLVQRSYKSYNKLFMQKRKEQMYAAQNVWEMEDYSRKYAMIEKLLEAMFPVLNSSRATIVENKFDPKGMLPKDKHLMDAISSVFENVAFFGDLLIRIHGIVTQIYRRNNDWHEILKWSVEFCNSTYLYQGMAHQRHINILAMEIGFIPTDQNYHNPFKVKPPPKRSGKNSKSQRNKRQRKPQLSNHIEL